MPTLPISAFTKTREELSSPDLQIQVFPGTYESLEARKLDIYPGVTLGATLLRPQSRGWVHIKSSNPKEAPSIFHNLLETEEDRKSAVLAMKICRNLMEAEAMGNFFEKELTPGKSVEGEVKLLEAARDIIQSNWHPTSTCRMGNDRNAVVNERLCVHGLGKLRVVDASVMPTTVSGNTNAATIMIGEKASDLILEDARK
jgi:choline dehydrogenase-like flavoprotein